MILRVEFHEIGALQAPSHFLMSSNELVRKGHWALQPIRGYWKPLAAAKARQAARGGLGALPGPLSVRALFRFPTERRRDTHNLSPVLKPILDGFVAGGLLTDDSDAVITSTTYERWRPNGPHAIAIEFSEVTG